MSLAHAKSALERDIDICRKSLVQLKREAAMFQLFYFDFVIICQVKT